MLKINLLPGAKRDGDSAANANVFLALRWWLHWPLLQQY